MSTPFDDPAKQALLRFLVVDLEATCWERNPPAPHEVIEIGATVYEFGAGVLDEFQTFVRPMLQPVLSPFCRQLTTISQHEVDAAPRFPQALTDLVGWADSFTPYALASWGAYDRKQLREDCARHDVAYPFTNHLNIKKAFADVLGCRPCGMAEALRLAGLPLIGTHHRGIDDVRNIARLLDHLLGVAGLARLLAEVRGEGDGRR